MDNCSNQMVLYGPPEGIAQVQSILSKRGAVCLPLPSIAISHGCVRRGQRGIPRILQGHQARAAEVPLYSCSSVGLFPDKAAGVRKLAAAAVGHESASGNHFEDARGLGCDCSSEVGPSLKSYDIRTGHPGWCECVALATMYAVATGSNNWLGVARTPVRDRPRAGHGEACSDRARSQRRSEWPRPQTRGAVIDNNDADDPTHGERTATPSGRFAARGCRHLPRVVETCGARPAIEHSATNDTPPHAGQSASILRYARFPGAATVSCGTVFR